MSIENKGAITHRIGIYRDGPRPENQKVARGQHILFENHAEELVRIIFENRENFKGLRNGQLKILRGESETVKVKRKLKDGVIYQYFIRDAGVGPRNGRIDPL